MGREEISFHMQSEINSNMGDGPDMFESYIAMQVTDRTVLQSDVMAPSNGFSPKRLC